MDRRRFQDLAELRILEARRLLQAGCPSGAYYLGGYAVECALKACFAKTIREHEFPDRKRVSEAYTHNLDSLSKLSEEGESLKDEAHRDPGLEAKWNLVKDWSERSRYLEYPERVARELLDAIDDSEKGVLTWLKRHW